MAADLGALFDGDPHQVRRQLIARFEELMDMVQKDVEQLYFTFVELQNLPGDWRYLPPPASDN
jgi:hypothetical protein